MAGWNDEIDEYEDRLEDEDPCDHEGYDTDILDGRCRCWRCGESWYATTEQIDAQLRFESEYYETMEREERRQWWRDRLWPLPEWWEAVRSIFRRRKAAPAMFADLDDDIPF